MATALGVTSGTPRPIGKRLFDVCLSIVGLIVLSPLLIGIAIAIRCTSRGPVFFRQVRIGFCGRPFTIL